jgi:hypothetical protein
MSNTKKRPLNKQYDIHAEPYLTHKRAIEISKTHIDAKPVIFLIK